MGYYSDVSIAIYGPEEKMVALAATERLLGEKSPLRMEGSDITWGALDGHDGEVTVVAMARYEGVKWYESFDFVQAWYRLLGDILDQYVEGDDECVQYEFLRVGEESGDISEDRTPGAEYWLLPETRIADGTPALKKIKNL